MRDRLIELLKQKACHYVLCDNECGGCKNVEMYDDSIESIADHLLANGVIVQPCKVGDTVYWIFEPPFDDFAGKEIVEDEFCWAMFEDFGKTVFLTREEAEQALKGE